jgi:hypothetical protein
MAKLLIALAIVVLAMHTAVPIALAGGPLLCRAVDGHQVCVVSIKRSAKNYWEYRAQLSIDDQPLPIERYDCRPTLRPAATDEKPSKQSLRQLICGLVKH